MAQLRDRSGTGSMAVLLVVMGLSVGCQDTQFDFDDPSRGPGDMVGTPGTRVTPGEFAGGDDSLPDALQTTPTPGPQPPDCGPSCVEYCKSLELKNPVNRGLCRNLWGVGIPNHPVVRTEACRRLFIDMVGHFPTRQDVIATCDGKTWGESVRNLMSRDEFVRVNQRRWADRLKYDTQAVSVERIYDMDQLVGKLYRGEVSYDAFAAVVSAHPVVTRRHDTPGDRAEAVFSMFMGRPPIPSERADLGRLYNVWHSGYYDHPQLNMRLPDAHIRYPCVGDDGEIDPERRGECTSVLWGYNELIIEPDVRASENERGDVTMWSGIIKAEEWERLQLPGKILSSQRTFWEAVVDDVLEQYLGYDLGTLVPEVREELVDYVLKYNGDIRALHFAVATSVAYLQSATGRTGTNYRWSFGPLKQVDAEAWADSIKHMVDYELSTCDHRLTRPQDFFETGSVAAMGLIERSRWELSDDGVNFDYRNLVRGLGGCPDNSVGGRFKIISILTTAQQLNFVNQVCDPALEGGGVDVATLLPGDVDPKARLTEELGAEIFRHQVARFYGRQATDDELADAREFSKGCSDCSAAAFARPTCFATLSSAEMLFY